MTNLEKNQTKEALVEKIERLGISQSEAARRIGVSWATISNIINDKWNGITGAWIDVQSWVWDDLSVWRAAKTLNFTKVQNLCAHAQLASIPRAISFQAGSGKTFRVKYYCNTQKNAFYVCAYGDMGKRQLLQHICKALGLQQSYRMVEMLEDIIDKINSIKNRLLVIDEVDELNDRALGVFKDIYNRCKTGFVLIGGHYLKKRILKGVGNKKQSMEEIYSRLGGRFHELAENELDTIAAICQANGISAQKEIERIYQTSKGDLRKVESEINTIKLNNIIQQQKQTG